MILEACGTNFFSWSLGFYYLTNFAMLAGVPYILGNEANYKYFCLGSGVLVLILGVFGSFYFLETQGINQREAYDVLRHKQTRKQILMQKQLLNEY